MSVKFQTFESDGPLNFELHSGEVYFDDVAKDIDSASNEVFVSMTSMGFDPEDAKVRHVTDSLARAASRGVWTSLGVDNFTFLDKSGIGPVGFIPFGGVEYFGKHGAGLAELKRVDPLTMFAGAVNYPIGLGGPTYMGRSHIKSATIGDKLYVGGISLDATDRLDAMASFRHAGIADWVTILNRNSIIKPTVASVLEGEDQSISFDADSDSKLLVDAGIRRQSVIYQEALDIIDNAEEKVVYASEQFPAGKVGKHLLRAYERGVEVVIPVNGSEKHDRYQLIHKFILSRARRQYPADFFAHVLPNDAPTLHTKLVANESRAMVGSHNLNGIGVVLGTAEMDVVSSDAKFVTDVHDFALAQIKQHSEA